MRVSSVCGISILSLRQFGISVLSNFNDFHEEMLHARSKNTIRGDMRDYNMDITKYQAKINLLKQLVHHDHLLLTSQQHCNTEYLSNTTE